MPILRLGIANPVANEDTLIAQFTDNYLVSVTAASKAIVPNPVNKVTIWVVPANASVQAQYAYACFNLELGVGQAFETFRFAVNDGDSLYVRSSVSTTSFSCTGIPQEDSALPENIVQRFTNKVIRGTENTLYIDRGLTSQRPQSADAGYVRYNTETASVEVKTPSGWERVGSGEGATGPTGPTGLQGEVGPTGPPTALLALPSSLIPDADSTRELGAADYNWGAVYTDSVEFSDSTTQTTAYTDAYTPTTALDWDAVPTTISGALDEIAARLRTLET